ncbi:MAG: hypothetical protein R2845_06010 [Thermomicrobiales bacterium]
MNPNPLGLINGWDGGIFTSLPGDLLHILTEGGDCVSSYEIPDTVDIGIIRIKPPDNPPRCRSSFPACALPGFRG